MKVYGTDGHERYVVPPHWALMPGVMRHSLGLNAIVGINESPSFTVRLLSPTGRVLQEQKVTHATLEVETAPTSLPFAFGFTLDKPVKNTRLRVRLPDGTLIEELRQLPYLPAGNHRCKWTFYHLRPKGTAFVARLETADGKVLGEQKLSAAAP